MAAADIPHEIVTDILVRLPVKSLVRFKCVCKSWRCLINDCDFAREHHNHLRSMENDNYIATLSVVNPINKTNRFFTAAITLTPNHQASDNKSAPIKLSVKEMGCPAGLKPWRALIKSCCDGILCMASDDYFYYLWNPSIHQYRRLPSSKRFCFGCVCGIGYDPSVNDYKVLKVCTVYDVRTLQVEVFAMKSNSWKTIEDYLPYEIFTENVPVFTNGGIHWVAKKYVSRELVILCFDVVTEKIWEVPLPPIRDSKHIRLFLFEGNLCFMEERADQVKDVWVMKEYGVRESWVTLVTIPQLRGHLMSFTRHGLIVLDVCPTTRNLLYNPSDNTYRRLPMTEKNLRCSRVIEYVESLISPMVGYENCS